MAAPVFAPDPSNCNLGRGKFRFDRFTTANVTQGYMELGNASEAQVDPQEEHVELPNFLTADSGPYADALVSRSLQGSLRLYEWSRFNIALMTGGNEASYTQAATAVTGETLTTSATLGAIYQTAKRKIGSVAVLQGTTTLVLTTDYTIEDANKGLIKITRTSSTVTAGATLTVNYTPTAITGNDQRYVDVAAASSIHGRLRFDGVSANGGPELEMIWWHVVLQGSQLQDLVSQQFGSSVLSFKVISDAAGSFGGSTASPYGRVWLPYQVT